MFIGVVYWGLNGILDVEWDLLGHLPSGEAKGTNGAMENHFF